MPILVILVIAHCIKNNPLKTFGIPEKENLKFMSFLRNNLDTGFNRYIKWYKQLINVNSCISKVDPI